MDESKLHKLSFVVSVYNEEKALPIFMDEFNKMCEDWSWDNELIFVDDGSIDNSKNLIKEFSRKHKNVKSIHFSRNFGHEAAMIAGIDYSTGDAVICMDVDMQHPLSYVAQIIELFENGYDVISMVRKKNESAGLLKQVTSKLFYRIINILSSQTYFEENASDFFAVSRRVANVLKNNYREKVRFLRGFIQTVGFKHTTLEYTADSRVAGESHYSIKNLFALSMNAIVCFSNIPLKIGIWAGLISALFGVIVLVYSLFTIDGAPSGYTTLIVFNSFMFAILFIVIGITGQYISVLFTEIKNRPIYLISDTSNIEKNAIDHEKEF